MEKIRALLFCTRNTLQLIQHKLEGASDIELSTLTSVPSALARVIARFEPSVVVIEVSHELPDPLALIEELRYLPTRLLILSHQLDLDVARQAIGAGVMGYLLLDTDTNTLESSIRLASLGKLTLSPQIIPLLMARQ